MQSLGKERWSVWEGKGVYFCLWKNEEHEISGNPQPDIQLMSQRG